MKSRLTKAIATIMTLAMIFSCMAFAAPAAFAANGSTDSGSSIDMGKLLEFAKEHPLLAKIGIKLIFWAAGNAVEGAGEGIGDYYEKIGENAGDRFEDIGKGHNKGDFDNLGEIGNIIDDIKKDATDSDKLGQAAADGATDSFPISVIGKIKPEIGKSLNEKLSGVFSGVFGKVIGQLPKLGK